MDSKQFEAMLSDAETRLRRLKTLYDQWFSGLERLEPAVARKELEDLLARLRREQVNNTALRFRMQGLVQRHTTFTTHWRRISRQIEEGTFKRDLVRARKVRQRRREPELEEPDLFYEVDVEIEVDAGFAESEAKTVDMSTPLSDAAQLAPIPPPLAAGGRGHGGAPALSLPASAAGPPGAGKAPKLALPPPLAGAAGLGARRLVPADGLGLPAGLAGQKLQPPAAAGDRAQLAGAPGDGRGADPLLPRAASVHMPPPPIAAGSVIAAAAAGGASPGADKPKPTAAGAHRPLVPAAAVGGAFDTTPRPLAAAAATAGGPLGSAFASRPPRTAAAGSTAVRRSLVPSALAALASKPQPGAATAERTVAPGANAGDPSPLHAPPRAAPADKPLPGTVGLVAGLGGKTLGSPAAPATPPTGTDATKTAAGSPASAAANPASAGAASPVPTTAGLAVGKPAPVTLGGGSPIAAPTPANANANPRPPPAAAAPRAANRPQPPAAQVHSNGTASAFSSDDVQRIYSKYVAARKENSERIDNVKLDSIEKTLRGMLPQLEKKHAGKKIDFEVVVKDGKVALKPVAK